ncbi:hypothetical protein GCM10009530_59880 [Microbispora corallina]|uniref:AbiTii domain-containing protein n=1 Tax=Microbispora corallina TaxID=83302 RepID=A0ABQ4GA54_9ACTN|nr:hypothetical protein [Microbispora corallina]GIH43937.1 hypothetical protein Mco01_69370 [Microbispora corallina]
MSTTTSSASRDGSLLDQIQREALDLSVPLSGVLLKCVALSGRAGSHKLREWAEAELNGYADEEDVPTYRVIGAAVWVDFTNRMGANRLAQQMSKDMLPRQVQEIYPPEVRLTDPVHELEEYAKHEDTLHLTRDNSETAVQFLTQAWQLVDKISEDQVVRGIYWKV